jgi:hypothetical protein
MISASLYIVTCSARNRFRRRLKRLREPRYLIGAIVGAAYLYFSFFARARARAVQGRRPRSRAGPLDPATVLASQPALAGVVLLAMAAVAWVLPFESGLLEFSAAETDLLFPAPVSRRALLVYRLLRSQIGMLFGSVIVAISSPVPGWTRLRIAVATWILFVTIRVYFSAVTLTRARARSGGIAAIAAWVPPAACVAALVAVGVAFRTTWIASPVASADDAIDRLGAVSLHGVAGVVLWPFAALARPIFAGSFAAFVGVLPGALVVLAVSLAWMLRADEAFQDLAAAAAARRAERAQTKRGGGVRARATGLSLALDGPPEFALFWKNGVQTLRPTGVMAIRVVLAVAVSCIAISSFAINALHVRGAAAAACTVAGAIAAFTAILGPQIVRTDLRSDLLHLELLKTWPVRAPAIIRGEIAWPGAMLTAIGWFALACAGAFSRAAFPETSVLTRTAVVIAAALLLPSLVFLQFLVQNAGALAFPAWVPLGYQRPRGVDAMGQRLILFGGVLLSSALLLVPAAICGGVLWFVLQRWIGVAAIVPGACVVTLVALVEVLAATELLGPLYERLDILAIERTEERL